MSINTVTVVRKQSSVEAVFFDAGLSAEDYQALVAWCGGEPDEEQVRIYLPSLGKPLTALCDWHWIIRGPEGDFSLCPQPTFERLFEVVDTQTDEGDPLDAE